VHRREHRFAGVGDTAGEHPVEHAAKGVDVGAGVDWAGLKWFRRGVVEGGYDRSGPGPLPAGIQGLGDAEIGEEHVLGLIVLGGAQQDVRGLDVPGQDLVSLCVVQRGGHFTDDVDRPFGGE
jgi:hypothetical protein